MNCIKLKHTSGSERLVPLGKPYVKTPEETRVDGIWDCDGTMPKSKPIPRKTLKDELDMEIGHGMGDWIKVLAKPVAKLVGKDKCSPCEAKRIVVNSYARLKAKYGRVEALYLMKNLWQQAAQGKPEQALEQLKAKLND